MFALYLDRRTSLARKTSHGLFIGQGFRQQKLNGNLLIELNVVSGYDDAHATSAENLLDAVLAGEQVAFPHVADYLMATQ